LVPSGICKILSDEQLHHKLIEKQSMARFFVKTDFSGNFDKIPSDALRETIDIMEVLSNRAYEEFELWRAILKMIQFSMID
jgi:hypothetical protein